MAKNDNLWKAKKTKNDEFYTQLEDIENELKHYKEHFKGKTVYCNCDDPFESNFFKYFAANFNHLKLKKLIAVSYANSPIVGKEISLFEQDGKEAYIIKGKAYKVTITELKDINNDGREDLTDVKEICRHRIRYLKGDGDFRSEESIELLQQADIIVTNCPFSLFREYVDQLIRYNKKFLIIGNKNAIAYKEVFPLIKDNKVWLGFTSPSIFILPDGTTTKQVNGLTRWFTNLDIKKRHTWFDLYKNYNPEEYPKYDNYDAINVDKTTDIPADYDGIMGVPVTFLDKYNPKQFEIIGMCENLDLYNLKTRVYTSQECKDRYFELFGKKGTYDLNASGVINGKKVYHRILIRRKKD